MTEAYSTNFHEKSYFPSFPIKTFPMTQKPGLGSKINLKWRS